MGEREAEAEMRAEVLLMLATGCRPLERIEEDAADYLVGAYDGLDEKALARMAARVVPEAVRAHAEAQATWPDVTDCDRLDSVLSSLEARGIACGAAEGWDSGDAADELMERIAARRQLETGASDNYLCARRARQGGFRGACPPDAFRAEGPARPPMGGRVSALTLLRSAPSARRASSPRPDGSSIPSARGSWRGARACRSRTPSSSGP